MDSRKKSRRFDFPVLILLAFLICLFPAMPARSEVNPEPYDRVIIIGVDGAGTKFSEGNTPNFDRIFENGIITHEARAPVPTSSAPGWGSMFYGVRGKTHGTTNMYASYNHKTDALYPSIFRLTREAYPKAKVASFANWYPINWGLIERDYGVYLFPDQKKKPTKEEIVRKATAYLRQNKPKLLFVYFEDLDDMLHARGFGSPAYFERMTEVDAQIGILYDELVRQGLLKNTLVIFATDHGGYRKGHGGDSEDETKVTFAITGPRLETNGTIEDMEIQDVAAIVLYALGIEQPESQTARIPKGIFPGIGGEKRKEFDLTEQMNHYGNGISAPQPGEPALSGDLSGKLVYYQNFDGEVTGLSGGEELSAGLIGNGLNMRTSYLKTGIKNNSKWPGITIGFWFRDDGDTGDPVFVADKSWEKGYNQGLVIAKLEDRIQVNIGGGKKYRKDILWTLPDGYRQKWIHCLVTFNQSTREATLYFDFEYVGKAKLLPAKRSVWTTKKEIIVGQDITEQYRNRMNADLDELMIFNQALTPEEVTEIRDCYEPLFEEVPAEQD